MADNYYVSFRKAVWEAITEVLEGLGYGEDVEVWLGGQNALEPSKTFCVIEILNVQDVGLFTEGYSWDEDEQLMRAQYITHMTALVQISVIGRSAEEVAPSLRQAFINNRRYHDLFIKKGLGITKRSTLRNNPQKLDTTWMDCFVFDVNLDFSFVDQEEYDHVETYDLEGKVVIGRPQ